MLNAFRVWTSLNQGAFVNKEDVKDLWDYMTVKHGHLTRGFAGGKTLESIDIDKFRRIERLTTGCEQRGAGKQLNFPESSKLYIRTILKNQVMSLMKPARIKLSTIHGM